MNITSVAMLFLPMPDARHTLRDMLFADADADAGALSPYAATHAIYLRYSVRLNRSDRSTHESLLC